MFIKEGENNSLHPGVITLKPGRRCWLSPFFIFVVCYVSVCLPTTQSHMLCHILLTTAADVHNVGMEDEREKLSKPQQIPLHNESVIFLHPHPRFCLFKKKKKGTRCTFKMASSCPVWFRRLDGLSSGSER